MQNIKDFTENKINLSTTKGGDNGMGMPGIFVPGIIDTGSGTIHGMAYTSDTFFDSNLDGSWGSGESIVFSWDVPEGRL